MIAYTICVDIKRFPVETLVEALNIWSNSIIRHSTAVERLIVYTNLKITALRHKELIEIRDFNESKQFFLGDNAYQSGSWQMIHAHKFSYWDELFVEFNKSAIWIDLDTFVCGDLDRLDRYDNFFTCLGTTDERPMFLLKNCTDYQVKRKNYINTGVFKLNDELCKKAKDVFVHFGSDLKQDEQDAINYICHYDSQAMNILGRDIERDTVNSFEAWNDMIAEHISIENSRHLLIDSNGMLKSDLHPDKSVNFIQFTFRRFHEFLRIEEPDWTPFMALWQSYRRERIVELQHS
jgi:hypothetical protein